MCSCSSLMRAVSKAICTSGEPVSDGSRRNWSMICVLRSLVIAISILATSAWCYSCLCTDIISRNSQLRNRIRAGVESKRKRRRERGHSAAQPRAPARGNRPPEGARGQSRSPDGLVLAGAGGLLGGDFLLGGPQEHA